VRERALQHLRCPACGLGLALESESRSGGEIVSGSLVCPCGRSFPINRGRPDFTYPDALAETDAMSKEEYDRRAETYDADLEWQFQVFDEDRDAVRSGMVDLLELESGFRVLEIGAGTGQDSEHILERVGGDGELYAQDLSDPMLEVARRNLASYDSQVEYSVGNASYLPFEGRMFDAAFHFGGLNLFGEIQRALAEMTRVVRPGGKIVVGDEGVAPWLRRKLYGRILVRTNWLYKHRPPLALLPVEAREVAVRWLLGDAFYLIDYRVGEGELPVNLDLPLPGKSDTLRSRYYGGIG
jgi:ubiquinone/menaquinone biosynthesis C-methylase UbiE